MCSPYTCNMCCLFYGISIGCKRSCFIFTTKNTPIFHMDSAKIQMQSKEFRRSQEFEDSPKLLAREIKEKIPNFSNNLFNHVT